MIVLKIVSKNEFISPESYKQHANLLCKATKDILDAAGLSNGWNNHGDGIVSATVDCQKLYSSVVVDFIDGSNEFTKEIRKKVYNTLNYMSREVNKRRNSYTIVVGVR